MNNNLVRKCPNCGASIEHNYNHKCPYCRTSLHMTNEKIRELNNCSIKVDRVEIERQMLEHNLVLTIMGWSIPKMHYYEEGIDTMIVSGDDVGRRVGYRIAIPYEMFFREESPNQLIDYVIRSLPPAFEESGHQIIDSIVEKFYKRNFWEETKECQ